MISVNCFINKNVGINTYEFANEIYPFIKLNPKYFN